MKQLLLITFLSCIVLPIFASKMVIVDSTVITQKTTVIAIPNNATIQQALGRKLTLKEKIGLLFVRTKYKKGLPIDTLEAQRANTNAIIGFIFSILALIFLPFVIPGYILSNNALRSEKEKPGLLTYTNKTLAQIGKGLAIFWAVLLLVAVIVVIIVLTGIRWV